MIWQDITKSNQKNVAENIKARAEKKAFSLCSNLCFQLLFQFALMQTWGDFLSPAATWGDFLLSCHLFLEEETTLSLAEPHLYPGVASGLNKIIHLLEKECGEELKSWSCWCWGIGQPEGTKIRVYGAAVSANFCLSSWWSLFWLIFPALPCFFISSHHMARAPVRDPNRWCLKLEVFLPLSWLTGKIQEWIHGWAKEPCRTYRAPRRVRGGLLTRVWRDRTRGNGFKLT